MQRIKQNKERCEVVGGEAAVAAMSEGQRIELGRRTCRFVRRIMLDPEIRGKIQARAAQLRAEGA